MVEEDLRTSAAARRALRAAADPADAANLQRFFRTGPGEYGEGDRFLGIRVPVLRAMAHRCRRLSLRDTLALLHSPWHEARLLALLVMVDRYRRGDAATRQALHAAYLTHTRHINNWDLVDVSAEHLVGAHLSPDEPAALDSLARSPVLWERRIAMLATFHWIKRGDFRPALHVAGRLVHDPHDLIHKAVGWMLREIGKRNRSVEEQFLRRHGRTMPRTALRYAIERFPEPLRQRYLRGRIASEGSGVREEGSDQGSVIGEP